MMSKMIEVSNHFRQCTITQRKVVLFEDPVKLFGVAVGCNLTIGAFTYIRGGRISALRAIGRFCTIAPGFTVGDGQHPTDFLSTHPFQYKGVAFGYCREWVEFQTAIEPIEQNPVGWIGSDVWIGGNVVMMRGVKVGHGSIITAGSVVTRDVPPYAIVEGVPARVSEYRFEPEVVERLLKLQWWNYTLKSLQGVPFDEPQKALEELERRMAAGLLRKRSNILYALENGVVSVAGRRRRLIALWEKSRSETAAR